MQKIGWIAVLATVLATGPVYAEEDRIVFKGDKVAVTYDDMERYLIENTPADEAERAKMLSTPDIFAKMAESLYTVKALAEEAERAPGFDEAQALWTGQILYQRRIATDYRHQYVEHVLTDVNWKATAKEAYQVEKNSYKTDEKVSASHILVTTKSRDDKEALALATKIRERVLAGEDFGELAKELSEDPSAVHNSGKLGFFKRGQMVKSFDDAVFDMREEGAISDVVKSPFGYHVIQYHARQEAQQVPFETVEPKIIEELKAQMSKKVWQDKLIAVRSAGDIVVDKELLLELQQKHQPEQDVKEH